MSKIVTKEKFTGKKLLSQLKICPYYVYECTLDEVFEGTRQFLKYVGYDILPPPEINSLKADFYAKRQNFQMTGIVRYSLSEMVEGFKYLKKIKEILGDSYDYVLTLPPVQEYWLGEYFYSKEGRELLPIIRRERFLLWLCKPKEITVYSLFNSPHDKVFNDFFGAYSNIEISGVLDRMDAPFKVHTSRTRQQMKREHDDFIDMIYNENMEDFYG